MLQQRGQVQTRRIYIKLSNPKVAKVLAIAWDAMDMSDVTDQGGPLYHVFWLYMFTGFLKRQSSKAFIFARGVLPFIVLHRVGFPVVGLEVCCHCATDLIWRTDVQETAWRCPWHADILKFLQIWETAVTHGRLQDGTSGCSGASSGEQISTWHHWNDPGGDVARIPTAAAGKCWVLTFLETFETFWNLFTSLYISLLFYWFLL